MATIQPHVPESTNQQLQELTLNDLGNPGDGQTLKSDFFAEHYYIEYSSPPKYDSQGNAIMVSGPLHAIEDINSEKSLRKYVLKSKPEFPNYNKMSSILDKIGFCLNTCLVALKKVANYFFGTYSTSKSVYENLSSVTSENLKPLLKASYEKDRRWWWDKNITQIDTTKTPQTNTENVAGTVNAVAAPLQPPPMPSTSDFQLPPAPVPIPTPQSLGTVASLTSSADSSIEPKQTSSPEITPNVVVTTTTPSTPKPLSELEQLKKDLNDIEEQIKTLGKRTFVEAGKLKPYDTTSYDTVQTTLKKIESSLSNKQPIDQPTLKSLKTLTDEWGVLIKNELEATDDTDPFREKPLPLELTSISVFDKKVTALQTRITSRA